MMIARAARVQDFVPTHYPDGVMLQPKINGIRIMLVEKPRQRGGRTTADRFWQTRGGQRVTMRDLQMIANANVLPVGTEGELIPGYDIAEGKVATALLHAQTPGPWRLVLFDCSSYELPAQFRYEQLIYSRPGVYGAPKTAHWKLFGRRLTSQDVAMPPAGPLGSRWGELVADAELPRAVANTLPDYEERRDALTNLLSHVCVVPSHYIPHWNQDVVAYLGRMYVEAAGFEGIMLRQADLPYKPAQESGLRLNRADRHLMKIKPVYYGVAFPAHIELPDNRWDMHSVRFRLAGDADSGEQDFYISTSLLTDAVRRGIASEEGWDEYYDLWRVARDTGEAVETLRTRWFEERLAGTPLVVRYYGRTSKGKPLYPSIRALYDSSSGLPQDPVTAIIFGAVPPPTATPAAAPPTSSPSTSPTEEAPAETMWEDD